MSDLKVRKQEVENRFKELESQRQLIVGEMIRLQGEARLINQLLEEQKDEKPPAKNPVKKEKAKQ